MKTLSDAEFFDQPAAGTDRPLPPTVRGWLIRLAHSWDYADGVPVGELVREVTTGRASRRAVHNNASDTDA